MIPPDPTLSDVRRWIAMCRENGNDLLNLSFTPQKSDLASYDVYRMQRDLVIHEAVLRWSTQVSPFLSLASTLFRSATSSPIRTQNLCRSLTLTFTLALVIHRSIQNSIFVRFYPLRLTLSFTLVPTLGQHRWYRHAINRRSHFCP